jgi:hypothetical protein
MRTASWIAIALSAFCSITTVACGEDAGPPPAPSSMITVVGGGKADSASATPSSSATPSHANANYVVFDQGYNGVNFFADLGIIHVLDQDLDGDCNDFYANAFGSPCGYPGSKLSLEMPQAVEEEPFGIIYYHYPRQGQADFVKAEAFYRFDGGATQLLELALVPDSGMVAASGDINVPAGAGEHMEFWLKLSFADGGEQWENNGGYGRNFRVWLIPKDATQISFPAPDQGWDPRVEGTLKAGSALKIAYDSKRTDALVQQAGIQFATCYQGCPISSDHFVEFHDASGKLLLSVKPDSWGRLLIPEKTAEVVIYVKTTADSTDGERTLWDSNFGKNFHFQVQP